MILSQSVVLSTIVQRLPDQPTHEAHLCLPAQMLRLSQVPTAFKEKARQVHGEEALEAFDTLPISHCDSASGGETTLCFYFFTGK